MIKMYTDYPDQNENYNWKLVTIIKRINERWVIVEHNGNFFEMKLAYLSHYPWRRYNSSNNGFYSYHSADYLLKFVDNSEFSSLFN